MPVSADTLQHRRVADEVQLAGHLAEQVGAIVGIVEQLPLVEQHDDRAAGGVDTLGQALVLGGHALGGVDDEQRDVRLVDGPSARTNE